MDEFMLQVKLKTTYFFILPDCVRDCIAIFLALVGRDCVKRQQNGKKTNNRHCCHSFFYFYLSLSLDVVFIVVCITLLRQGVQQRLGYSTMHALHTANVFFFCVVRTDLSL